MKRALVCGAGGFIGSHMVTRLKEEGYYVVGVDLKYPEFSETNADLFLISDLRNQRAWNDYEEIYQFAADMGGCQYVFSGDYDAEIMHNSAQINLNICNAFKNTQTKIFYSSSACMYPQELQDDVIEAIYKDGQPGFTDKKIFSLNEEDAYPANPDSEYGWEKLFSERLYLAYQRNYNLNVRIARFHNIYGPEGTYKGGREKAPASISRKVIEAKDQITIWGDGQQTRSFLYIDDCIDAVRLLMESDFQEPINIGSEEMVSINELWDLAIECSGKQIKKIHTEMPKGFMGVRGRNSDNTLIRKVLNWEPKYSLKEGLTKTYNWIKDELNGLHTK
jgi:nucleoside-diphosphate-sugar epimerase